MHQGGINSPFSLVPERPRPEIRTPEARVSASQGTHFLRFPVGKGLCRQLPLPGAHSRGASWHCLWYAHEPQLLQSTPSRALTSRQVTTPILPRALAGKTPVSAPTSNMHSGPSLSTPSIQTPYLGAGAPSTIGGARGLAGLLGPGLKLGRLPWGRGGCAAPAAAAATASQGSRPGCGKEEGQSWEVGAEVGGEDVHRCAQIREAFLASQWRAAQGGAVPAQVEAPQLLRRQQPA